MYCILHTYLHAQKHDPRSPLQHQKLLLECVPKMLCRTAAGVSVRVTRDVSHSIPTAGTGDSPRGQKWAKDRNLIPI